MQINKAF